MRAHVIENGKVANTIEVESLDVLEGIQLVDADQGGVIGDLYGNGVFSLPPSVVRPIDEQVAEFEELVDTQTDLLYQRAIGNRGIEYQDAANDAVAFRAAGYPETDVPDSVSSWAAAARQTPRWAADDILTAADRLTLAKKLIRANRLQAKETARTALLPADDPAAPFEPFEAITQAAASWAAFMAAIRAQLKIKG